MSAIGEKLLLEIQRIVARESDRIINSPLGPTVADVASRLPNTREVRELIQYSFNRPDIDISTTSLYGVLTILVDSGVNVEAKLKELLTDARFTAGIIDIKGSNSIKEDITEAFTEVISSKKQALPKHVKKEPEKVPTKVKPKTKQNAIRSVSGQYYGIANLHVLLNQRLPIQVRKNMGKGNARSILNYRTGRFANSTHIKRLTLNKDGSINAFYSYMKYPYQTFEPGYLQGTPYTRDPKTLIGKSIREIAKTVVLNKLKVIRE